MKAIILVIFVLFSFSNLSAQQVTKGSSVKKEMLTKSDFYNALIKANKFDIKLKNNTIVKSGYYNKSFIRNGFRLRTRKSSRLAYNNIKEVSLLHNYYID